MEGFLCTTNSIHSIESGHKVVNFVGLALKGLISNEKNYELLMYEALPAFSSDCFLLLQSHGKITHNFCYKKNVAGHRRQCSHTENCCYIFVGATVQQDQIHLIFFYHCSSIVLSATPWVSWIFLLAHPMQVQHYT